MVIVNITECFNLVRQYNKKSWTFPSVVANIMRPIVFIHVQMLLVL